MSYRSCISYIEELGIWLCSVMTHGKSSIHVLRHRLSCVLINQVPVLHLKYRVAEDIQHCCCHLDHDIFYFSLGNTCAQFCFTSLNLNVEHNVFYFPLEIHVLIFVSPFPAWSLFIKKEYGVMVWWIRNIKTYAATTAYLALCCFLSRIEIFRI